MEKVRQFWSSVEPTVILVLVAVLILAGVLGYAIWQDHQDKIVNNQISQPVQQSTTSESGSTSGSGTADEQESESESQGDNTEFGSGGGMGLTTPGG